MSDGMTDILRDQQRGNAYYNYLQVLIEFLESRKKRGREGFKKKDFTKDKLYKKLIRLAKKLDDIKGGYFSGRTSVEKRLEESITKLLDNDRQAWAGQLLAIADHAENYDALKKISPFKGKLLVDVDFGVNFLTLKGGELERFLVEMLNKKNMVTYDCDQYAVALDVGKDNEITWVKGGYIQPAFTSPLIKDRKREREEHKIKHPLREENFYGVDV